MKSCSMKIRAFNVGACVEFLLPNGKTVLVDPYFPNDGEIGCFENSVITACDYIIITHTHLDHDKDLGYLYDKFHPIVLCPAACAEELMLFHGLNAGDTILVNHGQHFSFEGFTLEFYETKHTYRGRLNQERDIAWERFGIKGHKRLDLLGDFHSLNFFLTTSHGFRTAMISGLDEWNDIFDICRQQQPNLLIRQNAMRDKMTNEQAGPKEYAMRLMKYHAQIAMPFHQDVSLKAMGKETLAEYFAEVQKHLKTLDPAMQFVVPKAGVWYDFGFYFTEADFA